jgi:molybdenum cofactor cytidylyltransferase
LNRVVKVACEIAEDRVIVVHGPKPTKCQRDIAAYPVENLVNEDWERGMSSSITTAMGAVQAEYEAVLILLCDQPLIEKEQIERLLEARTQNPDRIIASRYADTIGVPAIFPKKYFYKLQLLSGDQGARKLFSSLGDEIVSVAIPEAEFDIDTQEDFARLLFNHKP